MEQWVYCDTKEFIDHQWSYSCIALVKLSYETTEAMESWEKKKNTSPSHGVLLRHKSSKKRVQASPKYYCT
jgi:hypothetical protein